MALEVELGCHEVAPVVYLNVTAGAFVSTSLRCLTESGRPAGALDPNVCFGLEGQIRNTHFTMAHHIL